MAVLALGSDRWLGKGAKEHGFHGFVLLRSSGSPGQSATVEVVMESVDWHG